MTDLIDYPAIASPETQQHIDAFHAVCHRIRQTPQDDRRRARITLATSLARKLTAHRDELAELLEQGDRWLLKHPDDADEAQWFVAESEFRAIWDALESGLMLAFGPHPTIEQAQMLEVG